MIITIFSRCDIGSVVLLIEYGLVFVGLYYY
jgi:hypothetical protein